jgi:hypothetical protein
MILLESFMTLLYRIFGAYSHLLRAKRTGDVKRIVTAIVPPGKQLAKIPVDK